MKTSHYRTSPFRITSLYQFLAIVIVHTIGKSKLFLNLLVLTCLCLAFCVFVFLELFAANISSGRFSSSLWSVAAWGGTLLACGHAESVTVFVCWAVVPEKLESELAKPSLSQSDLSSAWIVSFSVESLCFLEKLLSLTPDLPSTAPLPFYPIFQVATVS